MQPELANPRIPSATPFTHASRAPSSRRPQPGPSSTQHPEITTQPDHPAIPGAPLDPHCLLSLLAHPQHAKLPNPPNHPSLMPGQLFTQYFLTDGIRQTPERQSQRSAFAAFRDEARRLFQAFPTAHNPNETQTEQDLIRPLLQLLGWTDDLPQQTTSGGEDRPDLLLFPDSEAKTRAGAQASPYLQALAVAELKRFRRPLDTRGPGKGTQASSPHAQILRYLRGADSVTDGDLRWGILTNGAVWRLYDQKTRPRATAYYEADLQALLQADDQDALRTFHLLFRRSAFLRTPGAAATFPGNRPRPGPPL